jgi:hypothetical protein
VTKLNQTQKTDASLASAEVTWFTTPATAAALSCSKDELLSLAKSGRIPPMWLRRMGPKGHWRFHRDFISRLILLDPS